METKGKTTPYVILEFWKLNHPEKYRKYILNGFNIADVGDLGPTGRVGWYIPHWMAQNNPFTQNYRYYRTVNSTRFISGAKTWVNYDEQIINNLKLNLALEYAPTNSTEKYLIQEMKKAEQEHLELVSYFYTPHELFSRPNAPVRVLLPPHTIECISKHNVERKLVDCDYSLTTLSKLQTSALETFPVRVQTFLKRMKITSMDQVNLLGNVLYESMTPREAACQWLLSRNNTATWKQWVSETPVQSVDKSSAYIISLSVVTFVIVIGVIGLCVLCCGLCIRRRSNRKRENRLAPKIPPISIVFTHIQGSSLLWTLDSDLMKKVVAIHHKIVRDNIRKFRGYEVKNHSDGFMMAFCDPVDALGCCFSIQNDLLKAPWTEKMLEFPDMKQVKWNNEIIYRGPRVRMGLHHGHEVEAHFDPTTKRFDYFGTTVNQAARTENESQGGRIYICSEIHEIMKRQIQGPSRYMYNNLCIPHKDPILQFKQLLSTGKIQFENMGNFVLKGLPGTHTLFWAVDTSSPRTAYIQQFELLPHIRDSRDSFSVPLLIEKIDKDRMELKQLCATCISDPFKMTTEDKSKLLHRLVLWNNSDENEKDCWKQLSIEHLISIVISRFILTMASNCAQFEHLKDFSISHANPNHHSKKRRRRTNQHATAADIQQQQQQAAKTAFRILRERKQSTPGGGGTNSSSSSSASSTQSSMAVISCPEDHYINQPAGISSIGAGVGIIGNGILNTTTTPSHVVPPMVVTTVGAVAHAGKPAASLPPLPYEWNTTSISLPPTTTTVTGGNNNNESSLLFNSNDDENEMDSSTSAGMMHISSQNPRLSNQQAQQQNYLVGEDESNNNCCFFCNEEDETPPRPPQLPPSTPPLDGDNHATAQSVVGNVNQ